VPFNDCHLIRRLAVQAATACIAVAAGLGARMDQDTIQALAQQIAQQLPTWSWQALVVQMVLAVVAFGAGIVFAQHRSQNPSGKVHSLDSSRAKAAEGVALDEGWREREWAKLRRAKLEVLVNRMHDCERFVEPTAGSNMGDRDPLAELQVITTLYFPELKAEVDRYLERCRTRASRVPRTTDVNEFGLADLEAARDQLSAAAQGLTTRIMGVAA
jgi:hypothetical protein